MNEEEEKKILMAGIVALDKEQYIHLIDLGLVVIPDTMVLEILANEAALVPTTCFRVGIRSVAVYRLADADQGLAGGLTAYGTA